MAIHEGGPIPEGVPLDVLRKSPSDIIVGLAKTLHVDQSSDSKEWHLNHSYQDWSEALVIQSKGMIDRKHPLEESAERPLFDFFCEHLRLYGVEISEEEQDRAFQALMED